MWIKLSRLHEVIFYDVLLFPVCQVRLWMPFWFPLLGLFKLAMNSSNSTALAVDHSGTLRVNAVHRSLLAPTQNFRVVTRLQDQGSKASKEPGLDITAKGSVESQSMRSGSAVIFFMESGIRLSYQNVLLWWKTLDWYFKIAWFISRSDWSINTSRNSWQLSGVRHVMWHAVRNGKTVLGLHCTSTAKNTWTSSVYSLPVVAFSRSKV